MTWTDEDRANVLALQAQGLNGYQIAQRTSIPERTVYDWLARARNVDNDTIRAGWASIVARAQSLQHDYMLALEQNDRDALILKHGLTLNAFAGTGSDKVMAHAQPTQNPTLVIVIPGISQPETIQGELA